MDDDEDFIPRSARLVELNFRTSKMVEDSPEFQTVKADTIILVKEFRFALKLKIMDTLRIEIALLRTELYRDLTEGINKSVTALLITENKGQNAHQVISTLVHYYYEELLDHTDLTKDEFISIYKTTYSLLDFPIPNTTCTMPEENMLSPDQEENSAQQAAIRLRDSAQSSKLLLLSTFSRPGDAYFQRVEDIEVNLTLKKLHTTDTLEDATADTTSRLNTETTADTELLESLISNQVTARTKNLSSEIGQLKKQLATLAKPVAAKAAAKNDRRGRPKSTGASRKKKEIPRSRSPAAKIHGNGKKPAPKAGASGKGSSSKPKLKRGKAGTKKKGEHK